MTVWRSQVFLKLWEFGNGSLGTSIRGNTVFASSSFLARRMPISRGLSLREKRCNMCATFMLRYENNENCYHKMTNLILFCLQNESNFSTIGYGWSMRTIRLNRFRSASCSESRQPSTACNSTIGFSTAVFVSLARARYTIDYVLYKKCADSHSFHLERLQRWGNWPFCHCRPPLCRPWLWGTSAHTTSDSSPLLHPNQTGRTRAQTRRAVCNAIIGNSSAFVHSPIPQTDLFCASIPHNRICLSYSSTSSFVILSADPPAAAVPFAVDDPPGCISAFPANTKS